MGLENRRFVVTGIHCEGCEQRIEASLKRLPGVRLVKANQATQQVALSVDIGQTSSEAIKDRLTELGYPVTDS